MVVSSTFMLITVKGIISGSFLSCTSIATISQNPVRALQWVANVSFIKTAWVSKKKPPDEKLWAVSWIKTVSPLVLRHTFNKWNGHVLTLFFWKENPDRKPLKNTRLYQRNGPHSNFQCKMRSYAERSCLRLDKKLRTITESKKRKSLHNRPCKQIVVIWLGNLSFTSIWEGTLQLLYNDACFISYWKENMPFFYKRERGLNSILHQELRLLL